MSEQLQQLAQSGHSLCWFCREDVEGEPLCPHCVKIQPLGQNSDFFSVMGLPRRLQVDPRVLEPVFHALSRRFHPDMYRLASPRERMIALDNSALLNQAYRTLRDPFERLNYLLKLEADRASETKDSPPADLFEEILEVQEALADYKFADPGEKESLRPALVARRDALQAEQDRRTARLTDELFARWDTLQGERKPDHAARQAVLDEMRRLTGERAYLRRVLTTLNDALRAPA